jgi:hypothetical protein
MIRNATISDCEPIAETLWNIWQQFKVRQIPSSMHRYASSEVLAGAIRSDLSRWLVCESIDSQPSGFFSLSPVGDDKTYKRWRFPEHSVRVENFSCLLPGEAIVRHLQLLASHLPRESILLCIPSSLRDAYWAGLKSGFQQLGDCQEVAGAFVWLYLDRDGRRDEIQAKLRRAKVVA